MEDSLSSQYRNRPRRNFNLIHTLIFIRALDLLPRRHNPNIMRRIALVLPPGKYFQDPGPRVRHADVQLVSVLTIVDQFHLHIRVVL